MPEWLQSLWLENVWANPWAAAGIVAAGSIVLAWIVEVAIIGVLRRIAGKTETRLDDIVLDLIKSPVYLSLLLIGFDWAVHLAPVGAFVEHTSRAVFFTIAIVIWSLALLRLSASVLKEVARTSGEGSIVQPRTVPLFDIISKSTVLAGSIYLTMIAWDIDVGAWLASAGVIGVAVGFAARDSLANYFAGVFIIADAPYKLHDVITLDDGTRGRVTDIGLRSTRIHTKDDVEINVPNSVLGNMKIENRSAGPMPAERVSVDIGVAYGSDVDRVIEILAQAVIDVDERDEDHPPKVHFVAFGASSLDFEVRLWSAPMHAEEVRHDMHVRIYKALGAASIEIPFPQTDLHIKELPASVA